MLKSTNWCEYRVTADNSKIFYAYTRGDVAHIDQSSGIGIETMPLSEFVKFATKA